MDTPQIPKDMQKYLGAFTAQMGQDEEDRSKLKMSKHIQEMDAELKDRFKALKSIQDYVHDYDEEEQNTQCASRITLGARRGYHRNSWLTSNSLTISLCATVWCSSEECSTL